MAKKPIITEAPASILEPTAGPEFGYILRRALETERLITQILENNLGYLDGLRRTLEVTNRKDMYDVREVGDTMATQVLAGIEEEISYNDLLLIIKTMKDGIAARRVADMSL